MIRSTLWYQKHEWFLTMLATAMNVILYTKHMVPILFSQYVIDNFHLLQATHCS